VSRKLLYIIPIVLPFLLYGLYAWWARRKTRLVAGDGGVDDVWDDAPWVWLVGSAVVLFIAALIATALLTGESIEGTYTPPHVVDGKVVPGEVN
jgi:hypothetical protein